MRSLPGEKSGIAKINLKLLYAAGLIATGIWLWPTDMRWFAFYAFSIICYMAAAALIYNTVAAMWQLQASRKEWQKMQARGNAPKQATLATRADQVAGGMK